VSRYGFGYENRRYYRRVRVSFPIAGCLWLLVASCAGAPSAVPSPSHTVQRFVQAVRSDDATSAYELLGAEAREKKGRDRFDALWKENRQELLELADKLERVAGQPVARARQPLAGEQVVVLVLEQGRWYVEGGVLDALALRTPLDAVAAFRLALQRRDLESLLRVLSRSRRVAWEAALDSAVEQTGDPLDLEVEIRGDLATVRTTGGGAIHLQREAGRWKVTDVE
jgi:limonene-1,2-epoxide hydrolase